MAGDAVGLAATEASIVARLAPHLAPLAVTPWPDDARSFRLANQAGAALVLFGGGRYQGDEHAIEGTQNWVVCLLVRNLRTHSGAYTYMQRVRLALQGWRAPFTAGPLQLERTDFKGHDDGIWQYDLRFQCPELFLADYEEPAAPLLKHVTELSPFGRTETIRHPDGTTTVEHFD